MVKTVIENAQVFDGQDIMYYKYVVISNDKIEKLIKANEVCELPEDAIVVNAQGYTLLPGLFDASEDGLREALKFGVMTEFEMQGGFTKKGCELQLKGKTGIADVLSAGVPDFILKKWLQ